VSQSLQLIIRENIPQTTTRVTLPYRLNTLLNQTAKHNAQANTFIVQHRLQTVQQTSDYWPIPDGARKTKLDKLSGLVELRL